MAAAGVGGAGGRRRGAAVAALLLAAALALSLRLAAEEARGRGRGRGALAGARAGEGRPVHTEHPFSSSLYYEKRAGVYHCHSCSNPLFSSEAKYDSGTGWPSFFAALNGSVDARPDLSVPFHPRTEVQCNNCKSHLGHVFDDGPQPTGKRYCMNGVALRFEPAPLEG